MDPVVSPAPARRAERALRVIGEEPPQQTIPSAERNARDQELVRWVGRLGAATLEQLRERFGLGRTVAYRRTAACIEGGLIERVHLLHGRPAFLRATVRGLRYTGLPLPVAQLSPELANHWLACGWAALRLARASGSVIVTERELRLQERVEGRPLASATLDEHADGSLRLHRPDLVLVGEEGVIAIEVELTPKAPQRLDAIVKAWRGARCVDRVRYYAAAGTTMRGLERAVERRRAEGRVELLPLEAIL